MFSAKKQKVYLQGFYMIFSFLSSLSAAHNECSFEDTFKEKIIVYFQNHVFSYVEYRSVQRRIVAVHSFFECTKRKMCDADDMKTH